MKETNVISTINLCWSNEIPKCSKYTYEIQKPTNETTLSESFTDAWRKGSQATMDNQAR